MTEPTPPLPPPERLVQRYVRLARLTKIHRQQLHQLQLRHHQLRVEYQSLLEHVSRRNSTLVETERKLAEALYGPKRARDSRTFAGWAVGFVCGAVLVMLLVLG